MLILPNQEKFIVLSKRFLYYDTKKKDGLDSKASGNEEITPIYAEFNYYYLTFVIVT